MTCTATLAVVDLDGRVRTVACSRKADGHGRMSDDPHRDDESEIVQSVAWTDDADGARPHVPQPRYRAKPHGRSWMVWCDEDEDWLAFYSMRHPDPEAAAKAHASDLSDGPCEHESVDTFASGAGRRVDVCMACEKVVAFWNEDVGNPHYRASEHIYCRAAERARERECDEARSERDRYRDALRRIAEGDVPATGWVPSADKQFESVHVPAAYADWALNMEAADGG